MPTDPQPLSPGQRLTADWLNRLLSWMKRIRIVAASPLQAEQNGPVWTLSLRAAPPVPAFLPDGGIAGRSGTAPGVGSATLATWDGTHFQPGTETRTVRNPFQAATPGTGIKACWIAAWQGDWWLVSWEC